ncbi:cytochrome c [Microbacteriaceae bacterium SG_E_30_P1]|uniref:Cytochrome c n=1 Tax=Antiquaquibacter oligotrophicus TaxID=2880260 RepID=A0ABT6KPI8_9MICO|nr:ThuA domain-containing protein [Antiquaquibacter oligotrophicus]MDH6181903.1 cytochrome c [Antiquaquibacter oligotrophicus]UDF12424.1 ThuA domain-containing protein [Antiquaquibacter oligotrophicus]
MRAQSHSPTIRRWTAAAVTSALVASGLAFLAAPAAAVEAAPAAAAAPGDAFKALVFSKTAGFRHGSIPSGIAAIEQLGIDNNFEVDATEDAADFTEENLAQYDVVIWLSTTGDVLNDDQQAAFEDYIESGGGYAGIHAASDTEYSWPWYGGLVGAYFSAHPQNQTATIKVEDKVHPSTAHLDDRWVRYDEWYNYQTNPRGDVHVLASLDETTYTAGTGAMGADHPIAWCQNYEGGRSWYTGGGHTNESFAEPAFLQHLLGGIQTAAGVADGQCAATQDDSYQLVQLLGETNNPMMLEVTDDGDVFYVERDGRIRLIDGETLVTTTALTLSVFLENEDGLQGMVLDPEFDTNGWIYAYWSPANVGSYGPHNALSRFTYNPDTRIIDPASRVDLLRVPVQRDECCHVGGDMIFDNDGNLILVTGDNTNPHASSGYSPMDGRAGREAWDARRSSGNTNDLRGKVLRITPQADGTYTIPEGNLWAPGTAQTLPEIYAMGFRNPFRIDIDRGTGNLLVADYGPDAANDSPTRGPGNRVEWNIVSEPGNYGWPFCTDRCYNRYNFATNQAGEVYDPENLVNDSPHNTGLTQLPDVIFPEIWYNYAGNPAFPEIGGGGAPMAGPTYQFDPELESDVKWPEYWDGKALLGEWNTGKVFSIQLDEETGTDIIDINRVLPGILDPSAGFARAMDLTFGPDGALYVIDWGNSFWGNNADSGIYRVEYTQGDPSPIARAASDVTSGGNPLEVQFSSDGSRHPAGLPITYSWDFGDGATSTEENPVHTYTVNGQYTATLTVSDGERTGQSTVTVTVGNAMPEVSVVFPDNGGFFEWGDQVRYEIVVNDPDGEFICENVTVHPALGHDSHAHPMEVLEGCEGFIQTTRDDGHGLDANIFWVIEGRYTDDGGDAGIPLTGFGGNILQPKRIQSEYFTSTGRLAGSTSTGDPGVQIQATEDVDGLNNIGYIEPGDWWAHEPISFYEIESLKMRVASNNNPGVVSVRWGAPDGPELGQISVPNTGGWQSWQTTPALTLPESAYQGSGTLYFVLLSGGINVNWMEVEGRGVTNNVRPSVQLTVDTTSGEGPLEVNASVVASDPDGEPGDELTYQWDQGTGDGFQPGTASESFTYTEPGTWRLTVRVTDAGGAYNDAYREITVVEPQPTQCFAGRSDDFLGTELDENRWEVLNRDQFLSVANGSLTMPISRTDFYGANNTTVPNLVLQPLPDGPFTVTTKITADLAASWQQAGLVIYDTPDNYAKISLQHTSNPNERRMQFLREVNAAPNEVDASNVIVPTTFPDTYWVRLTSTDGSNLTASYSADGLTFLPMSQTKSIADLVNPKIGLLAVAGTGAPTTLVPASFDWFHITPDDTATTGPDDEFDGTALDACRWDVVNENTELYEVANGSLRIQTTATDFYQGNNTPVPNLILQPQPGENWVVETKVDGTAFDRQYQQGGIILYGDEDNYAKVDYMTTNAAGATVNPVVEMRSEVNASIQNPQPQDDVTRVPHYLRLERAGTTFTGSYSTDGVNWTVFESVQNPNLANARLGVYALGASQTASAPAYFDYFRVVPAEPEDTTAPTVSGSATGRTVTVTAEDTESGVASIEYQLPGGQWTAYTAPFEVPGTDAVTVSIRATDNAGNVSIVGSVQVAGVGDPDVVVDRIAGANRYEVAVNISQAAYPETAPVVYVASGENYPDALSAGPAAAFEGGPLLLVKPGELPAVIGAEIARLAPEKIVVVGGPASVDDDVFYELSGMAAETVRIAGANRFEVSRNVAQYAFGDEVPLAYIATGEKFPDALTAGGAAGSQDAPVILVRGSAADLDDATAALLADFGTTQTRVLGGSASVSPGVFSDIKALTAATRLGGADRYEAARAINADAFTSADRAFIATGLNFPDALAGSAWAAASASPMYVAPGSCITPGVLADLEMLGVTHVTLLGGEASLTPAVFALTPCA